MKQHCLLIACLFLLSPINFLKGQVSDYDKGKAVGMMYNELSNSMKEAKATKLANQQAAISTLKSALDNLEKGNIDEAYSLAENAMVSYPKYTLSYLIMAYAAVEKGDYLNSNRMMNLYSRYRKKDYNKNLNSNVPEEFVTLVMKESEEGKSKLSNADLVRKYKTEPWLNNSLELQLMPSALIYGEDTYVNTIDTNAEGVPEFANENNIALVYKKYFWLNKKGALPYTNNNVGICLNVGANLNFVFPDTYYPLNYKVFLRPGLFINKFYISPGEFRYFKIPDYPNQYNGYEGNSYASPGFLISPEFRLFPGVLNAYATDMKKLSPSLKSSGKFAFGYVSLKYKFEKISGSASEELKYTRYREEILLGFGGYAGKRRTLDFGMEFGIGDLVDMEESKGIVDNEVIGNYWKIGFVISKRIL